MNTAGLPMDSIILKMPAWTPGYYQLMHYADKVENFKAFDQSGNISWQKKSANSWKINTTKGKAFSISYDVKATHNFVAGNFVNEERAYLSPTGVFVYPDGMIDKSAIINIVPYYKWSNVATGLPAIKGTPNSFYAENFDVLFDSPILMGNLDSFPSFKVKNIPHYLFAYKPGVFNTGIFMNDVKKIVETASGIFGDIPYKDYSFLAIGPGGGGIEHLNSTSIAFNGNGLDSNRKTKTRLYSFLAHEYFHHYNVKRIRPVELGPFDYDNGSRTKMLWLSEGITVYYEQLILKRAGLISTDEMLKAFETSIRNFEAKPGRLFQTVAEASYQTWEDGPFGRTGDEVNKTISPYDKGVILGLMLDFKIRNETKNKKSLDDLMRLLYNKYYKNKKRGFTEEELKQEAEKIATVKLTDFFENIYTLKKTDYSTYFGYAGLNIDLSQQVLPASWTGINLKQINDSLTISDVEWQSPAWEAGLRKNDKILLVNNEKTTATAFKTLQENAAAGTKINIRFSGKAGIKNADIVISHKTIIPYTITKTASPTPLQKKFSTVGSKENSCKYWIKPIYPLLHRSRY